MSNLIVPGAAFMIASSPETFKLMRKVAGNWVSSAEGVATLPGLFLHTLFFLLVLWLVGKFMPRMSGYAPGSRGQHFSCSMNSDCKSPYKCKGYNPYQKTCNV
jgi:uncharacterized membrane protein YhiD involved in acid resistance